MGVVLVTAVTLLGGCRRGSLVDGKVIAGDVPFVMVVDRSDPRLSSEGVAGAVVTGRVDPGSPSSVSLGDATADKKGGFSFRVREQTALSKPIEFRASAEGFMQTLGKISSPPPQNRAVLIIMKRTAP